LNERGQPGWHLLDGDVDIQDNVIFASQGVLLDRSRENLGDSDRGIVLYRHLLDAQMKNIEAGKDPINVFRDPAQNVCLKLPTESRERFLTGRLGARTRYSPKYRSLLGNQNGV
jgi:5,5'-dehydrodivanillate O-demethylase